MQNTNKNSGGIEPIQFDEADELLDIRYDNIFKVVFTKETPASKGALSGLISALIERKTMVQTIMTTKVCWPMPGGKVAKKNVNASLNCWDRGLRQKKLNASLAKNNEAPRLKSPVDTMGIIIPETLLNYIHALIDRRNSCLVPQLN